MVQTAVRPPIVREQWIPMTWEEFLDWCDEGQSEWVDGKGIAYVSNSIWHEDLVDFFASLLKLYLRVFGLGRVYRSQVLMRLPARPSGRMPDILVIRTENLDRLRDKWYEGPADFVSEFVSEDDPERDTVDKLREFEQAFLPEYLWVDARPGHRDFRFHRHGDDGYRLVEPDADGRCHSLVLPGFWFRPEWFWQDPLPDADRLMMEIAPEAYRAYLRSILGLRSSE